MIAHSLQLSFANWNLKGNQEAFFGHLAQKLGFESLDGFYGVSPGDIRNNGGKGLLDYVFGGSVSNALETIYPDHNWMAWRLGRVPNSFWEDENNQISFMNWLGSFLGFNKMEDWYTITTNDISQNGGSTLLHDKFKGSPSLLVSSVYPEHKWLIHQFSQVPKGHWDNPTNQRSFMDWLGVKLGFNKMEDWYKITADDTSQNGGSGLLSKFNNSPSLLVSSVYPEHKWLTRAISLGSS